MAPRTNGPKGEIGTEGVTETGSASQAAPLPGAPMGGTPPLDAPQSEPLTIDSVTPQGADQPDGAAEAGDPDTGYVAVELAAHLTIDARTKHWPGVQEGQTFLPGAKVAVPYDDVMAVINSGRARYVEIGDDSGIRAAHDTRIRESELGDYPMAPAVR